MLLSKKSLFSLTSVKNTAQGFPSLKYQTSSNTSFARRQTDQKADAVRLLLRLVRGTVAADLAALGAAVNDDVSLSRIRLDTNRLKLSTALVGSVSRVHVNVERPQTKRTVVARGVAQWLDLLAAMRANESVVVLCKTLLLHPLILRIFITYILSQIPHNVKITIMKAGFFCRGRGLWGTRFVGAS